MVVSTAVLMRIVTAVNTAVIVTIMKVAVVAMVVVMGWYDGGNDVDGEDGVLVTTVTVMIVIVIVMAVDNGVLAMVMIKTMIMLIMVMVMVVMMAEMVTVVKAVEANVHLSIISCNLTTLSGSPHLGDRKGAGTGKVIWQPD